MTAMVVTTDAKGATSVIATDAKRRWIDRVATGPERRGRLVGRKTTFVAYQQG